MKYKMAIALILIMQMASSCSKQDEIVNPIQSAENMLTGAGFTASKWKIISLTIDNSLVSLTSSQLQYQKQYNAGYKYLDTDGAAGTWKLAAIDSLTETYTNLPSGNVLTQGYKIAILSTNQLVLTYKLNSKNVIAIYSLVY